jgi:hypothetical protein
MQPCGEPSHAPDAPLLERIDDFKAVNFTSGLKIF